MFGLALGAGTLSAQPPQNDPNAIAKEAFAALDAQRFGDALDGFTRASKLAPKDPMVCLGAGAAAMNLGRTEEAERWLACALRLEPRFVPAAAMLGELQYRDGRLTEAMATLESVLKFAAQPALEQRLSDWKKEAQLQDRFYESRGAHFVVRFEGPGDESLARRVVERLEQAYWRIGGVLTAYPPTPIQVVLYTTEQFRDITRMPGWAAAAYDGRIRVPIKGALADLDGLDRVLSHEFAHAVVAMLGGPHVPVWLNEGLAVALEPGGDAAFDQVLARARTRPALQDLHGSFARLSGEQALVAYGLSAHAVKRMMALRGPYAVVALFQDLARGAEFAGAFQQRFAMRYDDFQAMVARD